MKKYFNKALVFHLILILIISLCGAIVCFYVYTYVHENEIFSLESRSETIAELIQPDELIQLSNNENDLENPLYQKIKNDLIKTRKYYPDTRFIYLLRMENDGVHFIADSEEISSPDYSPPGQKYDEASEALKSVFKNGKTITEGPLADRWGNWISVLSPIIDNDGNIVGVAGIDIDANKHMDKVYLAISLVILLTIVVLSLIMFIYHLKRKEEQVVNLKTDFIALASHELRSPLTHIRWRLSLLLNTNEIPISLRVRLKEIQETTLRLITMTNSIIETTASDHGLIKGYLTSSTDLSSVLRSSIENVKIHAREKEINFSLDSAFNAPVMVKGEAEKLELAFTNLLSNACKYSPEKSTVRIILKNYGSKMEILVADQGIGVPKAELKYIFSGFYRAKNAVSSGVRGSGFGLYMTKKIIEFNGGMIKCESQEGQGTTFIVTLLSKKITH